jgi:hypothetical protein
MNAVLQVGWYLIALGFLTICVGVLLAAFRYLDHLEAGDYPGVGEQSLRVQGRARLYDWAERPDFA